MLSMFGKNTWDKIDAEFREMNEHKGSLAEARAEIERLEKEVERLKRDKTNLHNTLERVFAEAANQWNDAIGAAAKECDAIVSSAIYFNRRAKEDDERFAEAIRSLKRS